MRLEAAADLARAGQLYPAVILHGGDPERRSAAAVELARIALCEAPAPAQPCGGCRHCRRVAWPSQDAGTFHPDFLVLERDLKTVTSVEATREMLRFSQLAPFEARGQVFVVARADSLSAEAADALLKMLEEPHLGAPRQFLLLAPSRHDLAPTLRSRSLAVYLGGAEPLAREHLETISGDFAGCVAAYFEGGTAAHLLAAADALARSGDWNDPRAGAPWSLAAAAVVASVERLRPGTAARRRLLALAEDLLNGPQMRVRGIAAPRILEGLVCRRLADRRP